MLKHNHIGRPKWTKKFKNKFENGKYCQRCETWFKRPTAYALGLYANRTIEKATNELIIQVFNPNPILDHLKRHAV